MVNQTEEVFGSASPTKQVGIGSVSSARQRGAMGSISPTDATNALDVLAEDNPTTQFDQPVEKETKFSKPTTSPKLPSTTEGLSPSIQPVTPEMEEIAEEAVSEINQSVPPTNSLRPQARPDKRLQSGIRKIIELGYVQRREARNKTEEEVLKGFDSTFRTVTNLTESKNLKTITKFITQALGAEDPNLDVTKEGVYWCAAFVNHILTEMGADTLGKGDKYNRLRAKKYANYGKEVSLENMQEGDILLFGVGDEISHVGFYTGERSGNTVNMMGGNQFSGVLDAQNNPVYEVNSVPRSLRNIIGVRRVTYDGDSSRIASDQKSGDPIFRYFDTPNYEAKFNPSSNRRYAEGGLADQTEEALGWTAEGKKFADANPVEVDSEQESTALSIANVPVFDRPMDASENDKWTGVQDELGNRQYKTIFGRKYFVRLADDQRTNYEKIQQDIIPAVKNYLDNPTAPSREQTVDFLKQSLGAAWETFKIPGDLAAGNKGMEDVTLGNIFELAGGTGAASTVGKVPGGDSSNTMRIFGGVGMQGTGTSKAFKKAKKLLKKRQAKLAYPSETGQIDFDTNKKIWEQTNWYVDPNDGQWRFYIDDSKSELKPFREVFKVDPEAGLTFKELSEGSIPRENSKNVLLKDFFDHTDLFEKYPELKELNVGFYSNPGSRTLGAADYKNNTIYFNLSGYENYEDMKSVVLHEIQHIVQEKEGFVPGSNERSIPSELVKKQETEIGTKTKPIMDTVTKLEREEKAIKGRIAEELEDAKKPIPGLTAKQEQEIFKAKPVDGGPSWASLGRKYGVSARTIQKAWGRVNLLNYLRGRKKELNLQLTRANSDLFTAAQEMSNIEFEFYKGAGGEIESRLVQAMDAGEKGLENDGFPVSARNAMLQYEGNKYQYRGTEGVDPLVYTNQPRREPEQKSFLDRLKSKVGVSNNSELETSQTKRYRDDIDPEVYDAFDELAEIQRGNPEIAMTSAQRALEGGVLSYALEHTGDLTHRMAEKGGVYGTEYVKPKINRLLDSLTNEYGFEKEHLENLKNTAQFNYDKLDKDTNLSFEQFYQEYVDKAEEKIRAYAQEHKKVPVYNAMQLAGREAAIALGEGRYTDAIEHLYTIKMAIDDGSYSEKSIEFNPKIDFRKSSDQGFAQGGVVNNMNNQMEMLFDEGGIADDGMRRDPVSGNEIPPGSLAEEVRDDIPAQLSEGEYVVPADVVRFFGVKYFEDLRMEAKMGLSSMEANGRIGGEPIPAGGPEENPLTPEEMAVLEQLGMAAGGFVPEQEPPQAVGNSVQGFAPGGDVQPTNNYQDGTAVLPSWASIPGASYMPQEWQQENLPSTTSYRPAQTITTEDSAPTTTTTTAADTTTTETAEVTSTTGKEACEKMGMVFDPETQQCIIKQESSGSDDPPVVTSGETQNFKWKEPDVDYFSMSDEDLAKVGLETSNKFEDKLLKGGAFKLLGGAGVAGFGLFDSVRQGSTIAEVRSAALVAAAKGNDTLAETLNKRAEELVGKSSLLVQGADYFGALSGVNDFAQQVKFKMPKGMDFDQSELGLTESQQVRVLQAASPPGMVYEPKTQTYVSDERDNSPPGGGGTFVETSSEGTPIYTPTSTTVRPVSRPTTTTSRDNSPPKVPTKTAAPKTSVRPVSRPTTTSSVSSGVGSREAAENSSQRSVSTSNRTDAEGINKGGLMKKRKKKY